MVIKEVPFLWVHYCRHIMLVGEGRDFGDSFLAQHTFIVIFKNNDMAGRDQLFRFCNQLGCAPAP